MSTSSDLMTLCQSQVTLLTQGFGAALTIVYLTEELTASGDTHLIPAVAHPEAALNWGEEQILAFLTQVKANLRQRLLATRSLPGALGERTAQPAAASSLPAARSQPSQRPESLGWDVPEAYLPRHAPKEMLLPQQQIVRPLIYQEQVIGLLLTARAERAWTETEQAQIEQIVQTLTLACVLDRRAQWLTQDLQQQQLLEERKTDLYDDLLHQFRNPLTALRTFGKLLIRRLSPSDTNRSVVESIIRESDRLQELLKQLDAAIDLDVADLVPLEQPPALPPVEVETLQSAPAQRLQLPETRLLLGSAVDLQPHRLTEVLQPLLDSASAIAQDRQLNLQTEIPAALPLLPIDLRALREVMNNLVDNALKYTPAQGTVYIGVQRRQNLQPDPQQNSVSDQPLGRTMRQIILVADSGPGIPPEDLQHLFTRHYRGVQAHTGIPGTGLGLAIARDLVQQMGGEIQIFSPALGCELLPEAVRAFYAARPESGTVATVTLTETLTEAAPAEFSAEATPIQPATGATAD